MTPAEFKLLYPEFAAETDSRIQLFLDEAVFFMEPVTWSIWYTKGIGLYAAHQLALGNQGLVAGTAGVGNDWTSKRVGDVAISKNDAVAQKQAENPFMRSTYGQQWLYYQKLAGSGAIAV